MRHYIGVVHKDADSDYGISFPDFPGAVTAARTVDEVVEMAQEALALHVEGMLAEGESIPEPSSFEQVRAEPEFSNGVPVWVPLKTDALVIRVNVTLPAAILRRIDDYAEERGLTRSGFLAEAARHELDRVPRGLLDQLNLWELFDADSKKSDWTLLELLRSHMVERQAATGKEANVPSLLDALRARLERRLSTTSTPPEPKTLKAKRKPQARATPK
jgi:predicted RNase H-like HicB family nuclease